MCWESHTVFHREIPWYSHSQSSRAFWVKEPSECLLFNCLLAHKDSSMSCFSSHRLWPLGPSVCTEFPMDFRTLDSLCILYYNPMSPSPRAFYYHSCPSISARAFVVWRKRFPCLCLTHCFLLVSSQIEVASKTGKLTKVLQFLNIYFSLIYWSLSAVSPLFSPCHPISLSPIYPFLQIHSSSVPLKK